MFRASPRKRNGRGAREDAGNDDSLLLLQVYKSLIKFLIERWE